MRLNKSIERQLSRIEADIARREQPEETPRQRYERESAAAARRWQQKYVDCIFKVLDVMDDEFHNIAVQQLEAGEPQKINALQGRYEFSAAGLLPPLATGVCLLASRLRHQEGLSYPYPCAMPSAICQFLMEHGEEVFRRQEMITMGNGSWKTFAPQYAWICSHLQCSKCYYPIPCKAHKVSRMNLAAFLEGPPCPEFPFKQCPNCGGKPMYVG